MEDILTSHFHPKLESQKEKNGTSTYWINTMWGRVRFHRPKIIVGLCITTTYEDPPSSLTPIFPAILDTGFNRTLEIDQRHLQAILKGKGRPPVPLTPYPQRDGHGIERECFDINQNI